MEDREVPYIPGEKVSDQVGSFLKSQVAKMLRTRPNQFPGSQPVSFVQSHLDNDLMNRDYLVCEKSDGLRCLILALVNHDTGEEGCFLITRENEYFIVPNFHFPRNPSPKQPEDFDQPHDGTIIDGELVMSKNPFTGDKELRYLIFDCLAMDKMSVTMKPLTKRLYYAQEQFHKPYLKLRKAFPEQCSVFPFKLDFKNMTQSFKLSKVFRELKNLTHVSDGLILTCCETPYVVGTDHTLLKWKPSEENTIDFKIQLVFSKYTDADLPDHHPNKVYTDYDSRPQFKLWVWENTVPEPEDDVDDEDYKTSFEGYQEFAELTVSDEEWDSLKQSGEKFNGRIAECRKDENGDWKMLRFRDDKVNGNHATVVGKVLRSIKDAVTQEDLIAREEEIKNHWLLREEQKRAIEKSKQQGGQTAQQKPPVHVQQAPLQNDEEDDSDDFDDFEAMPTYDEPESPKYGDVSENPKRQKVE